ncbi:MAG TPA: hypothetical protein VKR29_09190 [Candidatus Binataceae bacterium]|jgi:hypothetical protein|nr:hypothetical protein [Candidatus Binataceae bacterium]
MPTIRSIQLTNLGLMLAGAAVLAYFVSTSAAIGCLLGGGFVIVNLFLLAGMAGFALAAARRSGGVNKIGLAAVPLKIALMIGLIYALFAHIHIDGLGFALGVLTQITAIIIETARTSMRRNQAGAVVPEEF